MWVGNEESGGGIPVENIVDKGKSEDSVGGVELRVALSLSIAGLELEANSVGGNLAGGDLGEVEMFEVGRPILKINKTVGGDQMIVIGCVEEGDYWKSYFLRISLVTKMAT